MSRRRLDRLLLQVHAAMSNRPARANNVIDALDWLRARTASASGTAAPTHRRNTPRQTTMMVARKAVPGELSIVETKRLARQLTASTEAVLGAMETFAATPASMSEDAVKYVRNWARDAVRDARRLHQTLGIGQNR